MHWTGCSDKVIYTAHLHSKHSACLKNINITESYTFSTFHNMLEQRMYCPRITKAELLRWNACALSCLHHHEPTSQAYPYFCDR